MMALRRVAFYGILEQHQPSCLQQQQLRRQAFVVKLTSLCVYPFTEIVWQTTRGEIERRGNGGNGGDRPMQQQEPVGTRDKRRIPSTSSMVLIFGFVTTTTTTRSHRRLGVGGGVHSSLKVRAVGTSNCRAAARPFVCKVI